MENLNPSNIPVPQVALPPQSPEPSPAPESGSSKVWSLFKTALNNTAQYAAHYAARGTIWGLSYKCDFKQLEQNYKVQVLSLVGNEGFTELDKLAVKITNTIDIGKTIEEKCKNETWFSFAKDLVDAEKNRIDQTIRYTILGGLIHLFKFASNEFPKEALAGKQNPQDFFCKVFVKLIDRFGSNLQGIEQIEAIKNPEVREAELEKLFKKLSRNIFDLVFPKGAYEIEIPGIAQWYLSRRWDPIVESTVPELLLSMYQASRNPEINLANKAALLSSPEVFDLTDKVSARTASGIWKFLSLNNILGNDWSLMGNSLMQLFKPKFGFELKTPEKIQEDIKQQEAVGSLEPFIKDFDAIFDGLKDNFSTFARAPEAKEQFKLDLDEKITSLKAIKDNFSKAVKELASKITNDEPKRLLGTFQIVLDNLQEQINELQKESEAGLPPTHFMIEWLNLTEKRVEEQLWTLFRQAKKGADAIAKAPSSMDALIARGTQTEAVVKDAFDALIVMAFKNLKPDNEADSFISSVLKQLIAVATKNMKAFPKPTIITFKTEMEQIEKNLVEIQKKIKTTTESISDFDDAIKNLSDQITLAKGQPEQLKLFSTAKEKKNRISQ